jgi:predicted dehydrogenase
VRDAHLPAYALAGFPVQAITNRSREQAEDLAKKFGIPHVATDVEELIAMAPEGAVFDLTLPANLFAGVLRQLPIGSPVLIQKPMGETMDDAREILRVCGERKLVAAVNFQLRFAPFVIAAKDLIDRGGIGELRDMEIRVNVETPWRHFPFLRSVERLEILYHSVHHIDCIRHFLGDPKGVYAKTLRHPELDMPASRSAFLLDYGDVVRANIQTNHFHKFGPKHQESYIKWEGTRGAIKATMGLLMNYPEGVPDVFEVCTFQDGRPVWESVPIEGTWFPHAFIGSMAQVMRAADGEKGALVTPVEDSIRTMACVESGYASSAAGGVDPRAFFNS